jgi:hypothetical protein
VRRRGCQVEAVGWCLRLRDAAAPHRDGGAERPVSADLPIGVDDTETAAAAAPRPAARWRAAPPW